MIWTILTWALLVIGAIGLTTAATSVGKERKPTTGAMASATATTSALWVALALHFLGVL